MTIVRSSGFADDPEQTGTIEASAANLGRFLFCSVVKKQTRWEMEISCSLLPVYIPASELFLASWLGASTKVCKQSKVRENGSASHRYVARCDRWRPSWTFSAGHCHGYM